MTASRQRRRGRGEGGIRKRADGRWEGTIDLDWSNGKRQRKFVYGRTRAEVASQISSEQQRLATGLAPTDGRRTTGQFLQWWAAAVLPGTVSRSSEETYRRVLRLYVVPAVGRILLAKLAPADVTEMMRAMGVGRGAARPLGAQTRNQARKVLSKALRRAEQEGLV
ncbi:MAG: tyrosine-type recombinase/integrase, partial [Acidimicrobiales bacterium]